MYCSNCGAKLPDDADRCPACGFSRPAPPVLDNPPKATPPLTLFFGTAFALATILFFLVSVGVPAMRKQNPFYFSVDQLWGVCQDYPEGAQKNYAQKYICLTGTVAEIRMDSLVLTGAPETAARITCYPADAKSMEAFPIGSRVSAWGFADWNRLHTVSLTNVSFSEPQTEASIAESPSGLQSAPIDHNIAPSSTIPVPSSAGIPQISSTVQPADFIGSYTGLDVKENTLSIDWDGSIMTISAYGDQTTYFQSALVDTKTIRNNQIQFEAAPAGAFSGPASSYQVTLTYIPEADSSYHTDTIYVDCSSLPEQIFLRDK